MLLHVAFFHPAAAGAAVETPELRAAADIGPGAHEIALRRAIGRPSSGVCEPREETAGAPYLMVAAAALAVANAAGQGGIDILVASAVPAAARRAAADLVIRQGQIRHFAAAG